MSIQVKVAWTYALLAKKMQPAGTRKHLTLRLQVSSLTDHRPQTWCSSLLASHSHRTSCRMCGWA